MKRRFAAFAWANLAYNLLVIMWGAVVRASGSGAGCGTHWPLCDGQVIPQAPGTAQLIEFSHRVTSGLALIGTVALLVWAFRAYPRGHIVRRGAVASLAFMLLEALIGAGLVLFELVAHNVSVARAVSLGLHLVNTFLLLAAITLTAWWASGGAPLRLRGRGPLPWMFALGLLGTALVGSSGAITALGDTLLQLGTLPGGVVQPIGVGVHPLVQLRIIHPILGIAVGIYALFLARMVLSAAPTLAVRRITYGMAALFMLQILGGGLNVTLKAPVWMQIIHLLMADMAWIGLVLLGAAAFAREPEASAPHRASLRPTLTADDRRPTT
jgi:cytochrome c oxidase assembly protein subunit 15